uniref:Ovule protein n=1 Tax=Schistosoma mansoni TaxID=6183 RepID=A0A5K4F9J6_SCHMA
MHNIHQSKRNTTHLLHSTRSPVTSINNIYTAHTHTLHTRTHTIIYQSSSGGKYGDLDRPLTKWTEYRMVIGSGVLTGESQ